MKLEISLTEQTERPYIVICNGRICVILFMLFFLNAGVRKKFITHSRFSKITSAVLNVKPLGVALADFCLVRIRM